jgi:hypothetical protein
MRDESESPIPLPGRASHENGRGSPSPLRPSPILPGKDEEWGSLCVEEWPSSSADAGVAGILRTGMKGVLIRLIGMG